MGWGCQTAYVLGSKAKSRHAAVGGFIAGHIADETPEGSTHVGVARLARFTHRAESQVRESIKCLETLGELTVQRHPGRSSDYSIRWESLEWDDEGKHDLANTGAGHNVAELVGIDLAGFGNGRAKRGARSSGGGDTGGDSRGQSEPRQTGGAHRAKRGATNPCNPK